MPSSYNFTYLGQVTNFGVADNPRVHDTLRFSFRTADKQQHYFAITTGAARLLWFALTHYLFPRAADQITKRAGTATIRPAESLSVVFAVKTWEDADSGLIIMEAINAVSGINLRFTSDEGHELWAALEEALHNVSSGDQPIR
jgi:hypothetical protein